MFVTAFLIKFFFSVERKQEKKKHLTSKFEFAKAKEIGKI